MSKRKESPKEESCEFPVEHVLTWATRDKVFKKAMRIASAKLSKDGKYVDFGTSDRAEIVGLFCVKYDAMKTKHEERVSDLFDEIDKEKYDQLDKFQSDIDARLPIKRDAAATYALLDRLKRARTEKKLHPSKLDLLQRKELDEEEQLGACSEEILKRAGL